MFAEVSNTKVNYTVEGEGKDVIFLHGWGQNIEMMEPLSKPLSQHKKCWVIDFPGFGDSPEPPFAWDIYDYVTMLHDFIVKYEIQNPTLVGHSFGGRVAIVYASKHQETEKLILLDAAGVLPKRALSYYLKVYSYKTMKVFKKLPGLNKLLGNAAKNAGSSDYQNASEIMKQVLIKTVNEDLTMYLPDIKAPTILIWGEEDDATPLSDGQLMEKEIPNAALISFPGAGHYAYLERLQQVLRIMESFLDITQ